jgi:GNAT superfamily N-acetyltransferase
MVGLAPTGRARANIGAMTVPLPDAPAVTRAYLATGSRLLGQLDGAWEGGTPSAPAIVSGLPIPTLNGVIAIDPSATADEIRAGLTEVDRHEVPYSVVARPGCRQAAADAARTFALALAPEEIPLMAMVGRVAEPALPGVHIRTIGPAEAHLHNDIAASAFGTAPEVFARVTEPTMRLAGARVYVVEAHGVFVATGLAITTADAISVFNIATAPGRQRRGYGTAVTARAINDGIDAGGEWAWLQSSVPGLPVYERLGFIVLERWSCWVSDPVS